MLAATNDSDQLQRVILDAAIEAVGAKGGMLVPPNGAIVQVGDLRGDERLQLPLTASRQNFGTLILVGDEFPTEDRLTAASFAAHAVVALENARLHRVVERQALVDGLTGLANRRQSEDALATEISRAARFDNALTVVLADLDDFKALNDRYGHPAGDAVLRAFAGVLQETLRDADLAGRWGQRRRDAARRADPRDSRRPGDPHARRFSGPCDRELRARDARAGDDRGRARGRGRRGALCGQAGRQRQGYGQGTPVSSLSPRPSVAP